MDNEGLDLELGFVICEIDIRDMKFGHAGDSSLEYSPCV